MPDEDTQTQVEDIKEEAQAVKEDLKFTQQQLREYQKQAYDQGFSRAQQTKDKELQGIRYREAGLRKEYEDLQMELDLYRGLSKESLDDNARATLDGLRQRRETTAGQIRQAQAALQNQVDPQQLLQDQFEQQFPRIATRAKKLYNLDQDIVEQTVSKVMVNPIGDREGRVIGYDWQEWYERALDALEDVADKNAKEEAKKNKDKEEVKAKADNSRNGAPSGNGRIPDREELIKAAKEKRLTKDYGAALRQQWEEG